jgi:hypothetical protein
VSVCNGSPGGGEGSMIEWLGILYEVRESLRELTSGVDAGNEAIADLAVNGLSCVLGCVDWCSPRSDGNAEGRGTRSVDCNRGPGKGHGHGAEHSLSEERHDEDLGELGVLTELQRVQIRCQEL